MEFKAANRFSVVGSTAILYCPAPSGATVTALIDAADLFDVLLAGCWRAYGFRGQHKTNCAKTYIVLPKHNNTTYLHRFLAKPGKGQVVDHINNRGTDNRRANLRNCSMTLNQLNRKEKFHSSRSGWRGVVWSSKAGKYIVRINNKRYGTFTDVEAAKTRVQEVLRQLGVTQ